MCGLEDLVCVSCSLRGVEEFLEGAFGDPGSMRGVLEVLEDVFGAACEMCRG